MEICEEKWSRIRFEASAARVSQSFDSFQGAGFHPILIKGWAIARRYPEPWTRFFTDIDICVPPVEYEAARAFLRQENLGHSIDLHCGIEKLSGLDWETLYARSEVVDLHGTSIRTLCDEDHLKVLATHWLNDGGARRDRLQDIYHCVNSKGPRFDWEAALAGLPAHRREWIAKVITVCLKYEGLKIEGHPFSDPESALPAWFAEALEREWNAEPLYPLYYLLGHPRRFLRQLSKRFPPNAIQASVEADAPMDESPRIGYQLWTFVRRIPRALLLQLQLLKPRRVR